MFIERSNTYFWDVNLLYRLTNYVHTINISSKTMAKEHRISFDICKKFSLSLVLNQNETEDSHSFIENVRGTEYDLLKVWLWLLLPVGHYKLDSPEKSVLRINSTVKKHLILIKICNHDNIILFFFFNDVKSSIDELVILVGPLSIQVFVCIYFFSLLPIAINDIQLHLEVGKIICSFSIILKQCFII